VICTNQFTDSKSDCKQTVIKFTRTELESTLTTMVNYLPLLFLFKRHWEKLIFKELAIKQ